MACIALTMLFCARAGVTPADVPVLVAPLGASAVLVFAVPASPLAQPWPVIGGNILSALVGVVVFRIVADGTIAAGAAVGAAILAMSLCRCLHPPGGAAALTVVIGGQGIHADGFAFAFVPVGLNSLALVLLALVFHRIGGHAYPHHVAPAPVGAALEAADVDAALADMHESFDIDRDDLTVLLDRAAAHATRRRGGAR